MAKYRYLIFLLALFSHFGMATDININGKVVASPCVVDTRVFNQSVELGRDDAHHLNQSGAGSSWVPFTLALNSCPGTTSFSTAHFSGEPADGYASGYKNLGTAANVVLQIASADLNTFYGTGSSMTVAIPSSTASAIFPLMARMYAPVGNASGGTFKTAVNISFTYQ